MSNSETKRAIARAREDADLARMRFFNALDATMAEAAPSRLGGEVMDLASDKFAHLKADVWSHMKSWPAILGSLALGSLLVWLVGHLLYGPTRAIVTGSSRFARFAWTSRNFWR